MLFLAAGATYSSSASSLPRPPGVAVDANAQNGRAEPGVRTHDGFFLRMAWGPAHLYARGRDDPTFFDTSVPAAQPLFTRAGFGIAANADVGGTALPGLVVGVSLASHMFLRPDTERGQSPPDSSRSNRFLSIGGLVLYYPNPKGGFNSGLTLSIMELEDDYPFPDGYALAPQLGYDAWVGEQWSLGGMLRATFARLTSSGDEQVAIVNVTLTTLALALTFQ